MLKYVIKILELYKAKIEISFGFNNLYALYRIHHPNCLAQQQPSLAQQAAQLNLQPGPADSPAQQAAQVQLFNFNFYSQW